MAMLSNLMNSVLHPVSTLGILEWMLWRWQINPAARLIILVPHGTGDNAINRLRVTLSRVRADLKRDGVKDMVQFGITSSVGKWTESNGNTLDVIYVNRFVERTHTMSEIFAQMGFESKGIN